ncbi:NUDIX hydrolase domain-like protein [Leptodontidium sp. MPI-SDFR-AT-0119]|nr:NUDIX hydrolase domain-like protein [Leptodontidium sp. MPI-SDFR-AT-0119]
MSTPPQVRVGVGVFILQTNSESTSNPSFLIGKRIGSHGSGTYALPGGHLEFGESPEECAAREVLEETGLKVSNVRFLTATNDVMEKDGKHYVTLFVVAVRDGEGQVPEVLEKEKCEGWEWIKWEELVALVERDGMGEETQRRLFVPLLNLVRQRPGVVPHLTYA